MGRQTQFEFLILEGAQAGLSLVDDPQQARGLSRSVRGLRSRRIARFGTREVDAADEGSGHRAQPAEGRVGHQQRARFPRSPGAAAASRAISGRFVDGKPIQNRFREQKQVPATSAESDALSKDLKQRGFKFVGSTIIYAHMQATGMVNDHITGCFRHRQCRRGEAVRLKSLIRATSHSTRRAALRPATSSRCSSRRPPRSRRRAATAGSRRQSRSVQPERRVGGPDAQSSISSLRSPERCSGARKRCAASRLDRIPECEDAVRPALTAALQRRATGEFVSDSYGGSISTRPRFSRGGRCVFSAAYPSPRRPRVAPAAADCSSACASGGCCSTSTQRSPGAQRAAAR